MLSQLSNKLCYFLVCYLELVDYVFVQVIENNCGHLSYH